MSNLKLLTYEEERQQEKLAIENAVKTTLEACDGKARMEMVLAKVLTHHSCPALYLEWTSDQFWALQMPKLLAPLDRIYTKLKKDKITEKKSISFNDLDDTIFYIPSKHRVIVHTGQSFKFLYVWKTSVSGFSEIHIRRFYDKWKLDKSDKWDVEDMEEFKKDTQKEGYKPAILLADKFVEEFADDYENPYPTRLSLETFKKNKFEMEYGDFRDKGYIASWQEFHGRVEGSMRKHLELKLIFTCFIPYILVELFENEKYTDQGILRSK
jgi:hypothetical protein